MHLVIINQPRVSIQGHLLSKGVKLALKETRFRLHLLMTNTCEKTCFVARVNSIQFLTKSDKHFFRIGVCTFLCLFWPEFTLFLCLFILPEWTLFTTQMSIINGINFFLIFFRQFMKGLYFIFNINFKGRHFFNII